MDLASKKFLQNTNIDTFETNYYNLDNNATLIDDVENSTQINHKINAQNIIDEAINKTTFSGSYFTIIEVNINNY